MNIILFGTPPSVYVPKSFKTAEKFWFLFWIIKNYTYICISKMKVISFGNSLLKIFIMKHLCLFLGAAVVALSITCVRWIKATERVLIEKERLELQVRRDSLRLNNAPDEEIREATMTLIDFERHYYGQLHRSRNK